MKWRIVALLVAGLTVAACGTTVTDRLVDACLDGAAQRLVDRAAESKP